MSPRLSHLRALTLTGAALVVSLAGAGDAAATTEPVPPDDSAAPSEAPAASDEAGTFDIPGGVRPDALEEGTWFDDSGRMWRPEASTVSDEKHAAFCDFLFGTPEEIAEVFDVDGLRLLDGSGFVVLGGGGTGYRCGYVPDDAAADDEQPVIYFTIWDKALEVEDDAEGVLEVFVLDVGDADATVLLALSEEFDGEMIDAEFAQAWLAAARDRLV